MNVLRTAGLVAVAVTLVSACAVGPRLISTPSAPTSSAAPTAVAAAPTPAPTATPVPATAPAVTASPATRVVVTLTDMMTIEPGAMTVAARTPVTFVVTNVGQITHEFTLGDADVQDEHEQEMMSMGGAMTHDEDNAISVAPGQTKELTYTFEMSGMAFAACHVPGHYPAGMKASISIVE